MQNILVNRKTLEKLLEKEPSIKDKILSFFKKVSADTEDERLSKKAKSFYKTYKKMFDQFADRNYQSNSMENAVTNMKQKNMHVSGETNKRYALDIDNFDFLLYNEIKLNAQEYARIESEALTWDSKHRNELRTRTLSNEITYRYVIDNDGIVHVFEREISTNIHDKGEYYANGNRQESDRLIEKLRSRQRNHSSNIGISKDGRDKGAANTGDNLQVQAEGRSDGTGHSENGNDANLREETQTQIKPVKQTFIDVAGVKRNVLGLGNGLYMVEGTKRIKYEFSSVEEAIKAENENIIQRYAKKYEHTPSWVKKRLQEDSNFLANERKGKQFALPNNKSYSYTELVTKGDLQGIVIDNSKQIKIITDQSTGDVRIDSDFIVKTVKSKCKSVETNAKEPTYFVEVADIEKNVEITRKGIEHGYIKGLQKNKKTISKRDMLNARVSLELPQILSESIGVNISNRSDSLDSPYAHIMMGTVALEDANGTKEYYAVRSVIEERVNQNPILSEAKIVGRLHAINAKKISSPQGRGATNGVALASSEAYSYSVSEFLQNVKGIFDDTFSNDVYQTLGVARKKTDFSKDLRYALPYIDPSDTVATTEVEQAYKPTIKDKVFTGWTATQIAFTNAQAGIEKVGKILGVSDIEELVQVARAATSQADEMLVGNQYRMGADCKVYQGEGLEKILRPIKEKGDEYTGVFFDYLFNYLYKPKLLANKRNA